MLQANVSRCELEMDGIVGHTTEIASLKEKLEIHGSQIPVPSVCIQNWIQRSSVGDLLLVELIQSRNTALHSRVNLSVGKLLNKAGNLCVRV
jgi:hypothetical protein